MLDSDTKRRIDTARDILVGKVPDPKSQVEQITIALIYKFMDDMDVEAEELGGQRTFFAGEFERYGWAMLMRSGLGGFETLNLYAEAIARMPENPGIPPLFRDIFKNAYLPYRDPETLKSFLKIIDEFSYDHSERLGDAFEYLLSVLGSQGDAGQFRTPRHIIDFIVAVVDPKKDETVLDPACGTAGFLISSYKHILRTSRINTDTQDGQDIGSDSWASRPSMLVSSLTPDERGRLAANFKGYDISPDMVRLSLVNMYLHGFVDPHVYEYDTLTSQDRWHEYADVILANPPFMSPKGGIRPHNRFSVQSKRSEVLFVDYMAEHLTPGGRAGIIVPEGVIFQSQTAYTQLRKLLVEEYLVAVVSLPAGVFNPYSGVKTSILILDKALARQSDSIAFFKVENDGFGLGAQRRPIDKNDLPDIEKGLGEFIHMDRQDRQDLISSCASCPSMLKHLLDSGRALIVPKAKIAANGDYNLSGERYREGFAIQSHFSIVELGEVAEVISGQSPPGESYNEIGEGVPFYQGKTEFREIFLGPATKWTTDPQRFAEAGDILMSVRAPVGPVNLATQRICIGRGLAAIRAIEGRLLNTFAFYVLRSLEEQITGDPGAAFASINRHDIQGIQIPLPPLDIQREIVAEIEGYQRVIDGARAVVDAYRPHIPIDPAWPVVELGQLINLSSGRFLPIAKTVAGPYLVYGGNGSDRTHTEYFVEEPTIVIGRVGFKCGAIHVTEPKSWITDNVLYVTDFKQPVDIKFLALTLTALELNRYASTADLRSISQATIYSRAIPFPPLATQRAIVAEIEAEQALVAANRELIQRLEGKIAAALARVWGETGQ